jgi:hypothetical protein
MTKVKQLFLMLIVASSLSAGALPSLADIKDSQTRINNLSTERRNDRRPGIQEIKDRFNEAASSNAAEDKLGNFEIQDLMSNYNQDNNRAGINCLKCRVTQP